MTIRQLHRINAIALATFIVAHLGNHLFILAGIEVHLRVMDALRLGYRLPGVEHVIVVLFLAQIVLGLVQLWRKAGRPGIWGKAQRISGVILAVFLSQHIIAALMTRVLFEDVDTNSYWAASVVQGAPHVWYFAPYYALGVAAMFVHIAVLLRFSKRFKRLVWPMIVAGPVIGVLVVAGLMGVFHPVALPPAHQDYIDNYWGLSANN